MRSNRLLGCLVLILASLHQVTMANTEKVHYLVVSELSVPFQVTHGNVSTNGIVSDIITEAFRNSGYDVSPLVASTKRIKKLIAEHQVHGWIAYDAKVWNSTLPEGEFIEVPLFEVRHSYLTCDINQAEIGSPNAIRDKQIALLSTFDYPELEALTEEFNLVFNPVKSYEQGFTLTSHGRTDGFVEMDIRLRYNLAARREPGKNAPQCFRFLDMGAIIPPYSIYLTVDKDMDESLKTMLGRRLSALKQNGQIQRIVERYTSAYLPPSHTP